MPGCLKWGYQMFGWYRSQIKEFGPVKATALLGRVAWSLTRARLANKFLAEKLECPCCGWSGRRFYDYIEVKYTVPNVACPQCDSHARHRTLFLWLNREYKLRDRNGVALVFAPEKALAPAWQAAAELSVYRLDIEAARRPNLLADLQQLPIADDAADLIWCHHVLEHIKDDRRALRELHRVLRPLTGELVVSVPMLPGSTTQEYGFPDPEESGHWRIYGDDFVDELAESGFNVRQVVYEMTPQERSRYGVTAESFYICTKAAAQ